MIPKPLLFLLATVFVSPVVFAQNSSSGPLTQSDLLRQIESLTPGATPSRAAAAAAAAAPLPTRSSTPSASSVASPNSLFDQGKPDKIKSPNADGTAPTTGEKKAKGPTEITALEATFDQKTNVAVFIGSVVVKDPEFNVVCDKMTAHLKHDEKPTTAPGSTQAKATPRPATPRPATPKPGDPAAVAPKKGGGLKDAFAITTSERRVVITQDKVEADGTITHSIGLSDQAFYDAVTGDIKLTGMPDVTQGTNRCIATDPVTWMILNRDGRMRAVGPHKTIIIDKGDDATK